MPVVQSCNVLLTDSDAAKIADNFLLAHMLFDRNYLETARLR